MTAHTPINGTPVLTAPAHIRGKIGRWDDPALKQARADWIASLPPTVTGSSVAAALGITKEPALRLLREHRPVTRTPARHYLRNRGVKFGRGIDAILNGMTWEQQDALEARCARTGETMLEALVAHWAEAHK